MAEKENKQNASNTMVSSISWCASLFVIFIGLIALTAYTLSGILIILMGIFINPKIGWKIYERFVKYVESRNTLNKENPSPKTITLSSFIKFVMALSFLFASISGFLQLMIIPAFAFLFLAYLWSPFYDTGTIRNYNIRISGWVKFILTWIILAILLYAGFYS